MNIIYYENHIGELWGEEIHESRSSQLQMQLLQQMLLTDMANGLRSDANKLSKVSDGYNKQ